MQASRLTKVLLVLAVLCGCGLLLHQVDDGRGIGWAPNVVRNWHDYGLLTCKGKLVTNPGGFEALTHPTVYQGMSPVCIYLTYLPTAIIGSTNPGLMAYHLLLALAVFWGTWRLLGRDTFAFWVAAASLLCAGYVRYQKILDPNTIPVLLAIPYTALALGVLRKPRLRAADWAGLFALTMAFTSLNWTAAWAYGLCTVLLFFMPGTNRGAFYKFVIVAGVSAVSFAVFSVLSKRGTGTGHQSAGLLQFLRGYTWGNVGYGVGLTTGRAAMRLGFVNIVGLLPVLLAWLFALARSRRQRGAVPWPAMAPLGLAILEVFVMRNYFGHHPWMSSPVVWIGLIFSLTLLRAQRTEAEIPCGPLQRPALLALSLVGCLVYGLAVLMFFRANAANQLSLVGLVRHHSDRSDAVAVVRSADPETARLGTTLDEFLDRRVIVVDDLKEVPAADGRIVVLSCATVPDAAWKLRAQSARPSSSAASWLQNTVAWFNRSIARRQPGDRMELPDKYFLYEPAAPRSD